MLQQLVQCTFQQELYDNLYMFYGDTQSRLLDWKKFRLEIDTLYEIDAIQATSALYNTAPISSQFLCPDFVEDWPDPWQLIVDNYYDDIAKALGMLYTMYYSSHNMAGEMRCYRDNDRSEDYNLAWLGHGKYILNYDLDVVVNNTSITNEINLVTQIGVEDLVNESNSSH